MSAQMLTGILTRNPRRRVAALRIPPAAETIGKLIQSGVSTGEPRNNFHTVNLPTPSLFCYEKALSRMRPVQQTERFPGLSRRAGDRSARQKGVGRLGRDEHQQGPRALLLSHTINDSQPALGCILDT